MAKVEEQESNDNEGSCQSSSSRENDIKNRLRKNHNKKKVSNTDEIVQKKAKKVSGSYWREPCKEILDRLKKDEKAALFRHPAVRSFAKQEDKEFYKEQIKEPRDLGTITKKLKNENYTPKDFKNDIELCWSNALTFNENDTDVYHCAEYLKEFSDKLFKEKGFDELLEKFNNEKENNNNADDKDMNTNDNTNNSNNTNDSNHTGDKLNLNESGLLENGLKEKNGDNNEDNDSDKIKKKEKKRKYSSDTNSNKEEESYIDSDSKKHHHHHHKMTGKKRRRHRHKDKENDKEKPKEENNGEEKKEKKRGRKRKKIDNDDIIKISKRKINFEDIKKKYPINYPVIASPEEIERIAKKNGKNKIKKMVKLNNTNKNHDNHHKNENHKRRGRIPNNKVNKANNINTVNSEDKNKKITYQFDWEYLEKGEKQKVDYILIDNKNDLERRRIENEQMANYDINCNSDNVKVTHRYRNTNITHNNINEVTENIQKNKKNEISMNQNTNNYNNNSNNNDNNVAINNNDIEINSDINNINNIEIVQKSNNASMDNSINEIKMINENNAVKVVDKGYDKSLELRIEIAKNFDNLTDSNMIDLLVYIENIRPQAIRILENDTIYIDMEAFNDDTFNKVLDYIKNVI